MNTETTATKEMSIAEADAIRRILFAEHHLDSRLRDLSPRCNWTGAVAITVTQENARTGNFHVFEITEKPANLAAIVAAEKKEWAKRDKAARARIAAQKSVDRE